MTPDVNDYYNHHQDANDCRQGNPKTSSSFFFSKIVSPKVGGVIRETVVGGLVSVGGINDASTTTTTNKQPTYAYKTLLLRKIK